MIALVYGILSLFNCMICSSCLPAIRDILHTPMAQYSVFVLKVPLNTKQANKQTNSDPWPSVTSDLRLPSQPQGITAHWLLPDYTAW